MTEQTSKYLEDIINIMKQQVSTFAEQLVTIEKKVQALEVRFDSLEHLVGLRQLRI